MQRFIFMVLVLLLVFPAMGQRKKKGDEDTAPAWKEGVVYALPRIGVRLSVTVVKEAFEPGPYAAYAGQLLGINDAKERPSVQWQLKDVQLGSFSEPDPEQVHQAMGEGAFLVSLTPDGCLAGINAPVEPPMLRQETKTNRFLEPVQKEDGFRFSSFNDQPLYMPGDSTTNYRPVRVKTEKKAAEAASRILECRLTRFHMAAGLMDEFHPDGTAYEVSLQELKKIEENYLSLFTGRKTYTEETFCFDFVPASASTGKGEVVFRFSENEGVLPASDLSGEPVLMKVEPLELLTENYTALAGSENPSAGDSGVFYRMPAVGTVAVVFDLKTIASARMVLPQFGKTAPLPERLLSGGYAIRIHPETGAIQSITGK